MSGDDPVAAEDVEAQDMASDAALAVDEPGDVDARCCRLPAEFNIYTAADTHAALRAWCDAPAGADGAADGPLTLDAGAVFEVDGAGVQLLLAADHSLQARQRAWAFSAVSETLAEALADLGLADWLAEHQA